MESGAVDIEDWREEGKGHRERLVLRDRATVRREEESCSSLSSLVLMLLTLHYFAFLGLVLHLLPAL